MFGLTVAMYERLGTELLVSDRYIYNYFRRPRSGEAQNVIAKIQHFLKYLRRLRELRIDKQKRRAIRITDALFDQGRPKFLLLDLDEIVPVLRRDYGWTDDELDLLDELIAEVERVRAELFRKYKYNLYVKYSTKKPLPF